MTKRWLALALTAVCGTPAAAQAVWQPSFHLVGSLDRGRGEAFDARGDLRDDSAASLGFGLDGRRDAGRGGFQAGLFVLAHDPASSSDRGLFAAGRLRVTHGFGTGWRFTLDDVAKLQRRDRLELSDLERNELALGIERRFESGRRLGLTFSDRRRGVHAAAVLGFERQALVTSFGVPLTPGRELQFQLGPQRFAADTARGWRFGFAAELLGADRRGAFALRASWLEPLSETRRVATLGPSGVSPDSAVGPAVNFAGVAAGTARGAMAPPLPEPAEPEAGLLGEGLIVDPLESDEDDWDLGRRKQELLVLGSWRLGERATLAALVRLVRERGPDLLSADPFALVAQERWTARLLWRRRLAKHATFVLQGAWQGRSDARPGFDYSRLAAAASLEIRP